MEGANACRSSAGSQHPRHSPAPHPDLDKPSSSLLLLASVLALLPQPSGTCLWMADQPALIQTPMSCMAPCKCHLTSPIAKVGGLQGKGSLSDNLMGLEDTQEGKCVL